MDRERDRITRERGQRKGEKIPGTAAGYLHEFISLVVY